MNADEREYRSKLACVSMCLCALASCGELHVHLEYHAPPKAETHVETADDLELTPQEKAIVDFIGADG